MSTSFGRDKRIINFEKQTNLIHFANGFGYAV